MDAITVLLDRYGITAKAALNASQEKNKTLLDLRHKGVEFEVNDTIYIDTWVLASGDHNKKLPASLRSKLSGPFNILKKISPVSYDLELSPSS